MRPLLLTLILTLVSVRLLTAPVYAQDTPASNTEEPSPVESDEQAESDEMQTTVEVAPTVECIPPCREGYACYEGTCRSRCNPPCPAGYRCTEQAQCESMGQTSYPAPPPAVYSAYKPGEVYPTDSQADYRKELNAYRDRQRQLVRFFVAPNLLFAGRPQIDSNVRRIFSYGFGLSLGVTKHFARFFGFQSRFATSFFIMTERDPDYIDDIPDETGLDLSLDATIVIGPFGPFFLDVGLVGSYREYFRDEVLFDDKDEYSWTRLEPKRDVFAAGGVHGLGFMMGDKSQYVLGGRIFIQPTDIHRYLTLQIYFSYVFGGTGEDPPVKQ